MAVFSWQFQGRHTKTEIYTNPSFSSYVQLNVTTFHALESGSRQYNEIDILDTYLEKCQYREFPPLEQNRCSI